MRVIETVSRFRWSRADPAPGFYLIVIEDDGIDLDTMEPIRGRKLALLSETPSRRGITHLSR